MPTYRVEIIPRAEKEFRALDRSVQIRISKVLVRLALDPFPTGSVKMTGLENTYRIRIGDYRALYRVQKSVVTIFVIKIGHRLRA